MIPQTRRLTILLLTGVILVSAGTGGALAQQDSTTADDEVRIVDHDITISDATVTLSDAILSGSGSSDTQIDHRKYTIKEATLEFNGVHVNFQGTEYVFCDITVTVDNVGLVLEDVKVN